MVYKKGNIGLDYQWIKFHYTVDARQMKKKITPYK